MKVLLFDKLHEALAATDLVGSLKQTGYGFLIIELVDMEGTEFAEMIAKEVGIREGDFTVGEYGGKKAIEYESTF